MTIMSRVLAVSLVVMGTAQVALAQSTPPSPDGRWDPWLGCWQLAEESMDDGSSTIARLLGLQAPRTTANAGAVVCVTPAMPAGVTMTTRINGRSVLTETIVADGTAQPLTEPDCRGWQRAEWSALGARLYAAAEITCGDQPTRKVSGMALMIAGPTWIDIQMIEGADHRSLRVRRYRRAADQTHAGVAQPRARAARAAPLGTRLSIADVKEASSKVAPETLQAAVLELKAGFNLTSERLLDLGKAGVPRGVIDLMVALSFPDRFIVERPARTTGGGGGNWVSGGGWGLDDFDMMWPYFAHPYMYTSYYAPFGYRYWGYYDNYYFQGPGFVVVNPGQASPAPQPSGEGRVVDGYGYTRIRRNQPEPTGALGGSGSGWSTASAGSSNSGSSGSGSGVSSGGYSSGGAGGGERTAQPRPPGGN